jgi:polo-like kinase 1
MLTMENNNEANNSLSPNYRTNKHHVIHHHPSTTTSTNQPRHNNNNIINHGGTMAPPPLPYHQQHQQPRTSVPLPTNQQQQQQNPPPAPPPPPQMILDPITNTWYRVGSVLGKGGFAMCYKCTDMITGKEYALKIVQKSSLVKKATERKLRSEIEIHKKLQHRHVVKFVKWFETTDCVYMILGLAENQTLMEMMRTRKRLTEPEVQVFGLQFISALKYLHTEMNVIHRDLKLGNILLTKDMDIVLADFGLAACLENPHDRRKTVCGTPNYLAPEILEGGKDGHSYEVDIWSLGVVLYTLLVGKPPFETTNMKATYKKIKNVSFSFPDEPVVSDVAKSLIRWILTKIPEDRPSLEQIERHAFFTTPPPPSSIPVSALYQVPNFYVQAQQQPPPPPLMKTHSSASSSSLVTAATTTTTNSMNVAGTLMALERGMAKMTIDSTTTANNNNNNVVVVVPPPRGDDLLFIKWIYENIERAELYTSSNGTVQQQQPLLSTTDTSTTTTPQRPIRTGITTTIVCYVDLAHTWGFGYLLSNGVMGIRFNDNTMLVCALESKYFCYFEHKMVSAGNSSSSTGSGNAEARYSIEEGGHPPSLQKKIKLIHTFRDALLKECKPGMIPTPSQHLLGPNCSFETLDFIKKHTVTNHSVMLWLNSGPLVFKFLDRSEITFSHLTNAVVFMSKTGERHVLTMEEAMMGNTATSSNSMKRIKYIKSALKNILDAKKAAAMAAAAATVTTTNNGN